jgi:hypothetical protein
MAGKIMEKESKVNMALVADMACVGCREDDDDDDDECALWQSRVVKNLDCLFPSTWFCHRFITSLEDDKRVSPKPTPCHMGCESQSQLMYDHMPMS